MRNKLLPLLCILPLLSACQQSGPLTYIPYTDYVPEQNLNVDEDDSSYYRKAEVTPIHTEKGDFTSIKQFLRNNKDGRNHVIASSKGEKKMLIIPVRFLDSSDDISLENKTIRLQNAFFGDPKTTANESVASFYNKSSYGQLRLTGEIAPWYTLDIKSSEWKKKGNDQTYASRSITIEAIKELRKANFDFSSFDSDDDGYLDMVYTIYDYPYADSSKDAVSDELFWAYTDFIREGENGASSGDKLVNAYCWSSFYFALGEKNQADSSIFIHETGHLLGLSDYYNTNSKTQGYYYQPTGFFDLMDSNQGDHTVFSKYLLNWSSPKVLKKGVNTTLKLKDFSKTGDYLLLPLDDQYNDNPFGEYLLLEYFSPNGLNKSNGLSYQDVDMNGKKIIFNFPSYHGLKVYHVNAKLGYFTKKSTTTLMSSFICLVGDEAGHDLTDATIDFAYDNSIKTIDADNKQVLYHLLESSGENTFKYGQLASNDTLFRYGDTFGIDTFQELSDLAGYTFKIVDVSTNNVSIRFTSKQL